MLAFLKFYLLFISFQVFATENLTSLMKDSIVPFFDSLEKKECFQENQYGPELMQEIENALQKLPEKIRVCSYNIFLYEGDDWELPPPLHIENRLPRLILAIKDMNPDIIAIQCCFEKHLPFLMNALSSEFDFYGKKLLDRNEEINGFFYKKNRFSLLEKETFSLLTEEEIPPFSDVFYHSASHIQLKDLLTNQIFDVYNTHLEFENVRIRQRQAYQIQSHLSKDRALILCGSFNSFPNFPDHPFPSFDGNFVLKILKKDNYLSDSKDISILGNMGSLGTYTNDPQDPFAQPFKGDGSPGVNLDHILVSPHFTVIKRAVNPVKINGFPPSEHQPLLADLFIKN